MGQLKIGCHLSISQGYMGMLKDASNIDAETFQFFTRNPQGGKAKPINHDDIAQYNSSYRSYGIEKILAHAPYTMNMCSKEKNVRAFAEIALNDDMKRMELIPGNMYNFHPGCHMGQGIDIAVELISDILNTTLNHEQSTIILLETMAGKGTEVGSTFEELMRIIELTECKEKLGVCLDTCHIHDAGYDIKNNLDGILEQFDRAIGLSRLKAIHLNDSMNPLGSHKDRHAKIGEGFIGVEAFSKIINNKYLKDLIFILETPNDLDGYAAEIKLLRSMYN